MRSEHGQATVDYVALIAAGALLLGAAAAVAGAGAPGVANGVLAQFRSALCVVSGAACPPAPRPPCTVASMRDVRHVGVSLALVRLDDDRIVLRERLSDGTIRLTVVQRDSAGVEVGAGGGARLELRGRSIGGDREARAGVQGVLGHGEVFYARGEHEADALLRAIGRRRPGSGGPRASEVLVEGGVRGLASVDLGATRAAGRLAGIADAMLGARRDRRSGELQISLGAGAAGAGLVAVAMGGNTGALDGQAVLGLTLDRDRRPLELSLSASGSVAAGELLPSALARPLERAGGRGAASSTAGRRWELGARVDLRDPEVAAAWRAFRRAPAGLAAIRRLGEQLRDRAVTEVRSYRVDSSSDGVSAAAAVGLRVGGELERTIDRSRLLAAATRPPFGLWEARVDCVGER
jgi:hypothetical protein